MKKRILVGLTSANPLRLIIPVILLVLAYQAFDAKAQTLTNLWLFTGGSDGEEPYSGLVQGNDGDFYGTTEINDGTVFKITSAGTFTNLYTFSGSPDGYSPKGSLVQGKDGYFWGTTQHGGTSTNLCGTVFRISPSGAYTSLYSFVGSPNDGDEPQAGLVQGSDGNFYGTTFQGGTSTNCGSTGCGSVFRISPNGTEQILYSFGNAPDGSYPSARLAQGSDGNFYGTTWQGGTSTNCGGGCGTIFRISPSGTEEILYSFGGDSNGRSPLAGLVQGSDGNFYSTTFGGGNTNLNYGYGYGTVFKISPTGSLTNLYSFSGADGTYPEASLVQGSDGNFYGTTDLGGTKAEGTLFRISSEGTLTTLYQFRDGPNGVEGPTGAEPSVNLVQGSDGNFYGTTMLGGKTTTNQIPNGYGTVFRLTVPLSQPPYPINQIAGVQLSGTNVVFSIPSIAYETYQLQFSSSMNPTNWVNVPGVSVTNSIGALLTLTNFGGAVGPQGFYRFAITP